MTGRRPRRRPRARRARSVRCGPRHAERHRRGTPGPRHRRRCAVRRRRSTTGSRTWWHREREDRRRDAEQAPDPGPAAVLHHQTNSHPYFESRGRKEITVPPAWGDLGHGFLSSDPGGEGESDAVGRRGARSAPHQHSSRAPGRRFPGRVRSAQGGARGQIGAGDRRQPRDRAGHRPVVRRQGDCGRGDPPRQRRRPTGSSVCSATSPTPQPSTRAFTEVEEHQGPVEVAREQRRDHP